ncbi:phage tail tape measure protein, partial [bacterium]|nr:phage tail tape measure protein [bacterium]
MVGEVKLAIILTASMRGMASFDKAGGGIRGIGAAAKSAIAPLALFAAYAAFEFLKDSIKIAIEFEQIMAEAGSIIGKTADEMRGLSLEIREMSKVIPKTPRDLGTALYDIFSAGITDTSEAMKALELSAKTASAGLTETATAAKAGISTMNAFGMEASELEHIFDVQFLTIKFGILRYEELAAVVGQLSPSAKAAGQSMEGMFAMLAGLTKKGLSAAEAATALARAMEGITRPAAIRAAAELGISFIELTDESIATRDEFIRQKSALDELSNSYNRIEADVKSLGDEMAKVSLSEAKNRLEISKIRRTAEKEGRDMTKAELDRIDEIESANADLAIKYSELSVSQQEARIQSTELNNAMEDQKIVTEEAQAAFDEQIEATGNFRPLVEIIKEIGDKYGHLGEAAKADIIGKMFPQIRAKRAILGIMGSEEDLMDMTDLMITQAGAMGEAYMINTDTAAAGHQLMQNAVEDLKIEIGEEMMPVMEQWNEIMRDALIPMMKNAFIPILGALMPILKVLAEVVGWLGNLFADYPELLWLIIGALIAWKIVQIALNIAMMANPIGLIIMAVAALIFLIVLLVKHWDTVVEAFKKVGDAFVWLYEHTMKPQIDAIIWGIGLIVEA